MSAVIGIIIIAGVGGFVYLQNNDARDAAPVENTIGGDETRDEDATNSAQAYTMTQVAAHDDASSCWTVINGKVYDLTDWITKHPGGQQAITQLCGADGSALFNGQHGGAPQQEAVLASFQIGELAE